MNASTESDDKFLLMNIHQPDSKTAENLEDPSLDSSIIINGKVINKKDLKDSNNKIVRSGRIITLPPIEAPTTRSKRLLVNADDRFTNIDNSPVKEKISKSTKM